MLAHLKKHPVQWGSWFLWMLTQVLKWLFMLLWVSLITSWVDNGDETIHVYFKFIKKDKMSQWVFLGHFESSVKIDIVWQQKVQFEISGWISWRQQLCDSIPSNCPPSSNLSLRNTGAALKKSFSENRLWSLAALTDPFRERTLNAM